MNKSLFILFLLLFSSVSFSEGLPEYYNLIDEKKASLPRAQVWGTCWAFSSIFSMESNLNSNSSWSQLPFEPRKLSPYHMDKFSGFTRKGDKDHLNETWYSGEGEDYHGSNADNLDQGLIVHLGGDYFMAAAYLANLGGAITSWSLPELTYLNNPHEKFRTLLRESPRYQKYLPKSIEWLKFGSSNIEVLKREIMREGVVSTLQFMEEKPFSHTHLGNEIHYYGGDEKPNHALNIVGWNDHLVLPPLKPGMWIVVDSDHVDDNNFHLGEFYIPYADKYVGQSNDYGPVQFKEVRAVDFKNIYSHARHGWTHTFAPADQVKNNYLIGGDEVISSIGFYVTQEDDEVRIDVRDSKGRSICNSISVVKKNRGFYQEDLTCEPYDGKVEVILSSQSKEYATDGSKLFSLLLNKGLPKQGEPILVESKASPGESFFRRGEKWYDLYNYEWPTLIDEGVPVKRKGTTNFSINIYTESLNE